MNLNTDTSKSGYKILHIKKQSPISMILFLVKRGSRQEIDGKGGIFHFIEHMMFKSTEKRNTKQIALDIELLGGESNAFTSNEYTGYYVRVLKDGFENAFEILSDALQNGKLDEKDIEIEKGNVIEEIRMYKDSPSDLIWEYVGENIFPNQPIGKRIIGTEESVKGITRQDIIDTLNNHYSTDNFLIVSVGDFEIDYTKKLCDTLLTNRKSKANNDQPKGRFNPEKKYNFIEKKDVNQTHAVLSFNGVENTHPDQKSLEVLASLIGDGLGSMLFGLLREELGIAYYVGAYSDNNTDCGAFHIYFGCNNEKFSEVVEKIFGELERIKKGDISDEELKRAQNLLYSSLVMSHESIGFLARSYGIDMLLTNKIETMDEIKEKVYVVNKEILANMAKKYLDENFSISYIANKEAKFG